MPSPRSTVHAASTPSPSNGTPQPSPLALVGRALRLRCPRCGAAPVFRGWFAMHERCPACARLFNRAPGYFLGAIYFNYGVTAGLMIAGYFAVFFTRGQVSTAWLVGLAAFCLLFPVWFFRYARALWLAFDERWDPWPNEEERRRGETAVAPNDVPHNPSAPR